MSWQIDDQGWIKQSLSDIQDTNFSIFTETARAHNQSLNDLKQGVHL